MVELYTTWSIGMIGLDPLIPTLVKWLHDWLIEIETSRDQERFSDVRKPFGGEFPRRIGELEFALRTGFLLFCYRTPVLAADYLRAIRGRRHNEGIVEGILKFRGSLAQAAPAELADLTATALIRNKKPKRGRRGYGTEGPFGFLDHQFLPASPAQGPFLELLTHAPQDGLPLIRRLVDHAAAFNSGGKPYASNAITIPLTEGRRSFPWVETFFWSRSSNYYCTTSALMALEAWAHIRIEGGEDLDAVLKDVLGAPEAPAAYLLVAIDLLLSHWPKTQEAAVPFLASPRLLSVDRERRVHDHTQLPDILGLSAIQKEPMVCRYPRRPAEAPVAPPPARKSSGELCFLILHLNSRDRLTSLLREEAADLEAPDAQATMADPALMVQHALNLIDAANWQDVTVRLTDGTRPTPNSTSHRKLRRAISTPCRLRMRIILLMLTWRFGSVWRLTIHPNPHRTWQWVRWNGLTDSRSAPIKTKPATACAHILLSALR